MSQLLQTALGYGPLAAGLRLLPWTAPPMVVAPLAGALADRYGNRPFMILGLVLQAAGYAWVAASVGAGVGYAELGAAFTLAGIGTSLCFPTVANAVMSAVPAAEAGVASGVNSAVRQLGGVAGVAALASVFAHAGGYGSAHAFIAGFTPALWVAVAFSALGILAALRTAAPAPAARSAALAAAAV
jgi:MFS family permease